MSKLIWDQIGERFYETGTKNGVLYVMESGTYPKGVAWSGLISVSENPSGAEASPFYADDIKYLNIISNEEFGATIECYTTPPEFDACDGKGSIATGVTIGQQNRKTFGMVYKTVLGNDEEGNDYGYKLHLIYGAKASPSERGYSSINESTEPMTLSYELTTTPVSVTGHKPTSIVTIDSTKVDETKLAALEAILFGGDDTEARLPLPDEIATLMGDVSAG